MAAELEHDHLVVIRIEGMHCHKCEQSIQKSLKRLPGVNEVEVDFPTSQASVLFDPKSVTIADLMQAVDQAGYRAVGFVRNNPDQVH
jgi:Cu+-exporting ATPase